MAQSVRRALASPVLLHEAPLPGLSCGVGLGRPRLLGRRLDWLAAAAAPAAAQGVDNLPRRVRSIINVNTKAADGAKDGASLEYSVKFPTPSSEQPSSLTSGSVVDEASKPPVVILLGWVGCQDKYLAKYSTIYSDKGCMTLRRTAPLECLILRRKMRDLGQRLLDELMDLNLNEHPVFFHVFSNGGAYLFKDVALAMQERAAPIKVLGVIWDSAPGERRFRSVYLVLKGILEARWPCLGPTPGLWPGLGAPPAAGLALVVTAWWLAEALLEALVSLRPQPLDPLAELDTIPAAYTGAHLFLYSPADKFVLAQDVERFASHRRALGELVNAVRFEDSAHVQHFPAHREAYAEAIYGFMRDVPSGCRPSPTYTVKRII